MKTKEEKLATRREWYKKNKKNERERLRKSNKIVRGKLFTWYHEYKSKLKCEICSENHPACLDFHHKDSSEKQKEISVCIRDGWSKERIIKEISKCQVICSNCHRKFHSSISP